MNVQRMIELTWSSQALLSLSNASFLFFSSCSLRTEARAFAWAWRDTYIYTHTHMQMKKNEGYGQPFFGGNENKSSIQLQSISKVSK